MAPMTRRSCSTSCGSRTCATWTLRRPRGASSTKTAASTRRTASTAQAPSTRRTPRATRRRAGCAPRSSEAVAARGAGRRRVLVLHYTRGMHTRRGWPSSLEPLGPRAPVSPLSRAPHAGSAPSPSSSRESEVPSVPVQTTFTPGTSSNDAARRRRDETCPVCTGGGTRRVQLVREGGGPSRALFVGGGGGRQTTFTPGTSSNDASHCRTCTRARARVTGPHARPSGPCGAGAPVTAVTSSSTQRGGGGTRRVRLVREEGRDVSN
jgi:hypothetical protein